MVKKGGDYINRAASCGLLLCQNIHIVQTKPIESPTQDDKLNAKNKTDQSYQADRFLWAFSLAKCLFAQTIQSNTI